MISQAVARWRTSLRVVAALNLLLWCYCAITGSDRQTPGRLAIHAVSHIQLFLSAVYVLGCAYRCLLPVYDRPRIVLVDSPLSSVIVGRSVASVAEMSFAGQWALILHGLALLSRNAFGQAVSLAIVPLIAVAELCSWNAVLTTAQLGHVVENSIWGLSAALVVASMVVIGPHRFSELYAPMIAWCIAGAVYAAFIAIVDVPMYWSRWIADRSTGRRYLRIPQGLLDAWRRRVVSYRWEDWKSEMPWMSLYFTLGVWSSISLVYASEALSLWRGNR